MRTAAKNSKHRIHQGLFNVTLRLAVVIGRATQKSLPLDRLLGKAASGGVYFYRRVISPHKGFRCAYASSTGGPSCSTVALNALMTEGFLSGVNEMTTQFKRCRTAQQSYQRGLIDEAFTQLMKNSPDWPTPTPPPPPPPICCACG